MAEELREIAGLTLQATSVGRAIFFLKRNYDCLSAKTCSGSKLLAANFLFGVVTYVAMSQNILLEGLGVLNSLRNAYVAALPGAPIPTEGENLGKLRSAVWSYLKGSAKCLVTGKGPRCDQRRAALFYMLGFWSAFLMKRIPWSQLMQAVKKQSDGFAGNILHKLIPLFA